jgi:hypothetical protein
VDVESVVGAPGLCGLSIADVLARATRGVGPLDLRVPEVHDHAILICVNVFKDKLVHAAPWALEDALRIVDTPDFDIERFVARAREGKVRGIVWMVADWMARNRVSAKWGGVRAALGGDRGPRPNYARIFRLLLERAPESLVTRIWARMASDDPAMWPRALRQAFALERGRNAMQAP